MLIGFLQIPLQYKNSIITLFGTLFIASVLVGIKMPIEFLPNVSSPEISIYIPVEGLSIEQCEKLITNELYQEVSLNRGIRDIKIVTSERRILMHIRYVWDEDIDHAETQLRSAVDRVYSRIPRKTGQPLYFRPSQNRVSLLTAVIKIKKQQDNQICKEIVIPSLSLIKGTGLIIEEGQQDTIIAIKPDRKKMRLLKLSPSDITTAIEREDYPLPEALYQSDGLEYPIKIENQIGTLERLNEIKVGPSQTPLSLISTISIDQDEKESLFAIDGKETKGITLFGNGDNPVSCVKRIRNQITTLNREYSHLFSIEIIEDNSKVLEKALKSAILAFIIGILAAFLTILLFTRNFMASIITSLMIPLSFSITLFVFGILNKSINLISLNGFVIASGMIIDNNILIIDKIRNFNPLNHKMWGEEALPIAKSITVSTLTTLIVFLPLFMIKGITGMLFKDLALTVSITLTASLFTALWLLPALCNLSIIGKRIKSDKTKKIETIYKKIVRFNLNKRKRMLWFAFIPIIITMPFCFFIKTAFLPPTDKNQFSLEFKFPPNYPLLQLREDAGRISKECMKFSPQPVLCRGGEGLNAIQFLPHLNSRSLQITLSAITIDRFKELEQVIMASPYSQNLCSAGHCAGMIESALSYFPERDEYLIPLQGNEEYQTQQTRWLLEPATAILRQFDLTPLAITEASFSIFQDLIVKKSAINNQSYLIKIKKENNQGQYSSQKDQLLNEKILIGDQTYRIGRLFKLKTISAAEQYFRINSHPKIILPLNKLTEEMKTSGDVKKLYPSELKAQAKNIGITALFSLIFLAALLALFFNSWKKPILILLALPLIIPGALAAIVITSNKLDLNSIIAILVLLGTAVNSTILLYQTEKKEPLSNQEIIDHSATRFRPVLMTTLTTIAALIPFLLHNNIAAVITGGLLCSTWITLFILPQFHPDRIKKIKTANSNDQ